MARQVSQLLTLAADNVVIKPNPRKGNSRMILKGVEEEGLIFSDRPARDAYAMPTDWLVSKWKDIFHQGQPNSSFTLKNPRTGKRALFVLETRNPRYNKKGHLIFDCIESKSQSIANDELAKSFGGYKVNRDKITGTVRGEDLSLFIDNGFLGMGGGFFGIRPDIEDCKITIVNKTGYEFDYAASYAGDWTNQNQWNRGTISNGQTMDFEGGTVNDFDIGVNLTVNGIGGNDTAMQLDRWIANNPDCCSSWISKSSPSAGMTKDSGSGTTRIGGYSFPYSWDWTDDGDKHWTITYGEAQAPSGM